MFTRAPTIIYMIAMPNKTPEYSVGILWYLAETWADQNLISYRQKKILMYWEDGENRVNNNFSRMDVSIVSMENYIFLERRGFL